MSEMRVRVVLECDAAGRGRQLRLSHPLVAQPEAWLSSVPREWAWLGVLIRATKSASSVGLIASIACATEDELARASDDLVHLGFVIDIDY